MNEAFLLPVIFMALMGISILAYVILDGYDLGVGILLRAAPKAQRDVMISAIGPFWDANETWLVLGVGLLLVAFPKAHGVILGALYLPVAAMLLGLTLRGVAFDFRYKAKAEHKDFWDLAFWAGSCMASLAQGFMLGHYITGFQTTFAAYAFAVLIAVCLLAGYALLGAGWLLIKTTGAIQHYAIRRARWALVGTSIGVAAVSLATPLISPQIFAKWFSLPAAIALMPIPVMTAACVALAWIFLHRLNADAAQNNDRGLARWAWAPFVCSVGIFMLAFLGLAYSLYPDLVIGRLTLFEAASAPESLKIILAGAVVVLPMIVGYTIFMYRVFWGKVDDSHGYPST